MLMCGLIIKTQDVTPRTQAVAGPVYKVDGHVLLFTSFFKYYFAILTSN